MRAFAETADRIAATTKKLQKTGLLADYLRSVPVKEAAVAAVFSSGRPFPVWEETTLQVGGSLLWRTLTELSGRSEHELTKAYRKHGDLGAVAEAVLSNPEMSRADEPPRAPSEIQRLFREIASARAAAVKASLVRQLLNAISPTEAKYVIKIMTGDLRIGLKESLVEESIAKAFDSPPRDIQRANMLLGDIGETLKLAANGRLAEAKMRLFHPLGFMLASPAESVEDALSHFQNARVEDKYDGIRAQAHCSGDAVRFFSRTRDDITESFPELSDALAGLPQDAILDGEIVAWDYAEEACSADVEQRTHLSVGKSNAGNALPFRALQQRLGRKRVSGKLMRDVPVAYVVFDVLYANGELLIDRSLKDRARILDDLLASRRPIPHGDTEAQGRGAPQTVLEFPSSPESPEFTSPSDFSAAAAFRAPVSHAAAGNELNVLFDAAQARGNEGLMIKDPKSRYTPGRRGRSWLKLKRELATLDVVVTAVEYGHGRRIGVLSDYTFAVCDGDRLLNVGKAYSGLTDAEIAEMTTWFLDHTIEEQGFRRIVEPKILLEVAFNNVMKSDRHASGYALRFPRILRLRPDKLPEEVDTLRRVTEIYERQTRTEKP
jgi:ATP-dependent DNA ligase